MDWTKPDEPIKEGWPIHLQSPYTKELLEYVRTTLKPVAIYDEHENKICTPITPAFLKDKNIFPFIIIVNSCVPITVRDIQYDINFRYYMDIYEGFWIYTADCITKSYDAVSFLKNDVGLENVYGNSNNAIGVSSKLIDFKSVFDIIKLDT